jgi:pimeloyl-ACP methyl ester carboxylesterase
MTPPPVFRLVPGLGLDEAAWRPTLESLPPAWRRDLDVALLPGYGERATRAADLRPAALAEVLLDRWCPSDGTVVLAGHSASCQIVAEAARRRPDRVAGLVLVGPTTDPRARSWSSLARRWLATARHESVGELPTLVRQYARTGLWTMARAMDAARRDDVRESVGGSRCPVLVVRGSRDRICRSPGRAGGLPRWRPAVAIGHAHRRRTHGSPDPRAVGGPGAGTVRGARGVVTPGVSRGAGWPVPCAPRWPAAARRRTR